jgi:FkbM family methyltransferase
MIDTNKQKLGLLCSINEMLELYAAGGKIESESWDDVCAALLSLGLPKENVMLSLAESVKINGEGEDNNDFTELHKYFARFYDAQVSAIAHSATVSESYKSGKYGSDRVFEEYMRFLRDNTHKELANFVYEGLSKIKETSSDYYRLITDESKGWYFESNWLDGIGGANNSLITNRISTLKDNISRLEWLYDNLADPLSRRSLNALIRFHLTWDYSEWREIALYYCDVVDSQIFPFYDDEVFVDCGSYIGDTVMQYINTVNQQYKRVYTYDISRKSIEIIRKNLEQCANVVINHKGTGDRNTEMAEVGVDQAFHGNKLSANGAGNLVEMVKVVRLDDDITEPITFLKIDCEGMDKETMRGAKVHIQKYHPKIHIDSYHKLADIVDIPELIRSFDPTYCLFLRLPWGIDTPLRFPCAAYMAI